MCINLAVIIKNEIWHVCTRCTDHTECYSNLKICKGVSETKKYMAILFSSIIVFLFDKETFKIVKKCVNILFCAHFCVPCAKFQKKDSAVEYNFSTPFQGCII